MYGYALAQVMERVNRAFCCFIIVIGCLYVDTALAVYEIQINNGITWLESQQNTDGSWGASNAEQRLLTAEAVEALQANGRRQIAFYKGVSWLENHTAENTDFTVKRALAIAIHGDSVAKNLLAILDAGQDSSLPSHAGWGVSNAYIENPLDTAIVLQGLADIGTSAGGFSVTPQDALDYLKTAQISTSGWPVSLGVTADAWSTAVTVQALALWLAQDASLATPINEGLATLNTLVGITSPDYLQALAATAALSANDLVAAQVWLTRLNGAQHANGSWSDRIYDTALALSALSTADGNDGAANQATTNMPDRLLRMAVNAALGRNALDALTCLELSQLTSLTASGLGITDLTGLECATNLTLLDLSNNQITSITPIEGLIDSAIIDLSGNSVEGLVPVLNVPIPPAFIVTLFIAIAGIVWRERRLSKSPICACIRSLRSRY